VCRSYSLATTEVLAMPIKRFWLLEKNISRLEALDGIRQLDITVASQGKEGYEDMHRQLKGQIGLITVVTPELDKRGLEGLRNMTF